MADFVTWYKDEATWRFFKRICIDKEHFGPSYAAWLLTVGKKVTELEDRGVFLVKVHIDPVAFINWCEAHSRTPDNKARAEFTALSAPSTG